MSHCVAVNLPSTGVMPLLYERIEQRESRQTSRQDWQGSRDASTRSTRAYGLFSGQTRRRLDVTRTRRLSNQSFVTSSFGFTSRSCADPHMWPLRDHRADTSLRSAQASCWQVRPYTKLSVRDGRVPASGCCGCAGMKLNENCQHRGGTTGDQTRDTPRRNE